MDTQEILASLGRRAVQPKRVQLSLDEKVVLEALRDRVQWARKTEQDLRSSEMAVSEKLTNIRIR